MTNFDERARDWDSDPMKVERARVVAQAIRRAIPLHPGMHALEYGCGTGLLSFALQMDFASITLADSSQGMLDVLADKIEASGVLNMHPVMLDLVTDPLPAVHFDIVFSLMTLHHVPDTRMLLQRFHAILKPGGHLCLVDLEKEDGSFHGVNMTDVHRGFDREALRNLAQAVAFQNVRFTTVYEIKKNIGETETKFPMFLMTAEKIPV